MELEVSHLKSPGIHFVNGDFHDEVLRMQKNMFRTLEIEADRAVGAVPKTLHSYRRNYLRDFKESYTRKKLQSISRKDLIQKIRQAPVTFVGDYHTFSQSQKTTLRLLRDIQETKGNSTPLKYLGLELISSQYQRIVDDYLAGTVDRTRFLSVTKYHEEWGFPWQNYEPLFDWAKENGVRIIALNRPKEFLSTSGSTLRRVKDIKDVKDLKTRDQWAAGLITDLYEHHQQQGAPDSFRMLVLYGDWHVARAHLPTQLNKVSKNYLNKKIHSLTIHQNEDKLYWKLVQQGKLQHATNTYRLGTDCYCIFSGTPWGKLQSLLNWAEGDPDSDIERMTEEVQKIAVRLCELFRWNLEMPVDTTKIEILGYSPLLMKRVSQLPALKKRIALYFIRHNEPFVFPKDRLGFYAVNSSHHATELASALIYESLHTRHTQHAHAEPKNIQDIQLAQWIDLIFQSAFSFFSSLILNPRRKCDLPQDLENPHFSRMELKKRRLALQVIQCKTPSAFKRLLEKMIFTSLPVEQIHSMARLIGKIYGTALYRSVTLNVVDVKLVKNIFEGHYRIFLEKGFTNATALSSYYEFVNRLQPEISKLSTKRDFF